MNIMKFSLEGELAKVALNMDTKTLNSAETEHIKALRQRQIAGVQTQRDSQQSREIPQNSDLETQPFISTSDREAEINKATVTLRASPIGRASKKCTLVDPLDDQRVAGLGIAIWLCWLRHHIICKTNKYDKPGFQPGFLL